MSCCGALISHVLQCMQLGLWSALTFKGEEGGGFGGPGFHFWALIWNLTPWGFDASSTYS